MYCCFIPTLVYFKIMFSVSNFFFKLLHIPFYDKHYLAFMLIKLGYTFVQTIAESVKMLDELSCYEVKAFKKNKYLRADIWHFYLSRLLVQ